MNNFYFAESKKSADVNVGVDPLQEVANKINTFNSNNNSASDDMFADVADNDIPF